ncbi:MAG: DUF2914 domain-containing protein [Patescibacteria group bacterium]
MRRVREFYEQYERRISAGSILLGFLFDSITLVRIDLFINHVLLFTYLAIVAFGIFIINLYEEGRVKFFGRETYAWLFIAMQFSFGGLFGRFFLYYFHSGSIAQSWPFLLALLALLISNEFAKKHYTRLLLQINFFFLALFLFLIFYIPILVGKMSDQIFVLSGMLALVVTYLFVRFLDSFVPERVRTRKTRLGITLVSLFVLLNVLYFANLIPPLPLALHDVGAYHSVARVQGGYRVEREEYPWFLAWRRPVLHLTAIESPYIFSAVFAPTHFGTSIVHRWERYDETTRSWVLESRVQFPIIGGQDYGYRGYSWKSNASSGEWRVNIETLRGQRLGRVKFVIERVDAPAPLVEERL